MSTPYPLTAEELARLALVKWNSILDRGDRSPMLRFGPDGWEIIPFMEALNLEVGPR